MLVNGREINPTILDMMMKTVIMILTEKYCKSLMNSINGARLSSSFGMRKHPILGFSKLHTGTDFAAL